MICKNTLMNAYEKERLVQFVLYILNKTGGLDHYHVFKVLYFAEAKHIAKWGARMLNDDLCALKYGPVPSALYNAVNRKNELSDRLWQVIERAEEDASNVLIPKAAVNPDYISESEIEALDASIAENAQLSFSALMKKSHDAAWREAYENGQGKKVISPVSMARVFGNDWTAECLEEQMELDSYLA